MAIIAAANYKSTCMMQWLLSEDVATQGTRGSTQYKDVLPV